MQLKRTSFLQESRAARIVCLMALICLPMSCDRSLSRRQNATPGAETVGDPERGRALISYYGCGSCHTIAGVPGANGMVGPPLSTFGKRVYIAGLLRNTPDNLLRWIRDPQAVSPGNVMPRMGIDRRDAGDIAAFLYTRTQDDR